MSQGATMKISFVIIAYNEEENIIDCIKSIETLEKLPSEREIVVVNDGSKDSTAKLVTLYSKKDSTIKLINQKNKGRGAARARGFLATTGELIAAVDADIILPPNWLSVCLKWIDKYDAVGGIAVPDGDVAYVFKHFRLKPKLVKGSTTITGNNGLYKSSIFSKVNFDVKLSYGEDTDFNHRLIDYGFRLKTIAGLSVDHKESKTFITSTIWAFQNGIGATAQLLKFKKIRIPDLAYFGFVSCMLIAIIFVILFHELLFLLLLIVYPLFTSFLHIISKFQYTRLLDYFSAIIVNYIFIVSYYFGRTAGLTRRKAYAIN
jgi:glycosyltransferase involved in cell wall biosynthesis